MKIILQSFGSVLYLLCSKHSMEMKHSRMIKILFRLLKENLVCRKKHSVHPLGHSCGVPIWKAKLTVFFSIPHPFAETGAVLCHVTRCAPYAILHPSGVTSGHSIFPWAPAPSILFFFLWKNTVSHCFWITGYFYYFCPPFLCTYFPFFQKMNSDICQSEDQKIFEESDCKPNIIYGCFRTPHSFAVT